MIELALCILFIGGHRSVGNFVVMALRKYTVDNILEMIFADQERETNDAPSSSAPESCFSEDEEEFVQGLDPYQDM